MGHPLRFASYTPYFTYRMVKCRSMSSAHPTDTRRRILQAAKQIAQDNRSIQGVTISLEAVAKRAGLTKPGLLYHFPTKEALITGLVDAAAANWAQMISAACTQAAVEASDGTGDSGCSGAPGHDPEPAGEPADFSVFARYRGYVRVATSARVSRADYWIFSDALYHPALSHVWHDRLNPWFSTAGVSAAARAWLTTARFCADGAWMSEATGMFPAAELDSVRSHALELVDRARAAEGEHG